MVSLGGRVGEYVCVCERARQGGVSMDGWIGVSVFFYLLTCDQDDCFGRRHCRFGGISE